MLVGVIDKSVNVLATSLEGGARVLERVIQIDSNDVIDCDVRRVPTAFGKATVHPVDVSIGAVRSRKIL